MPRAPSARQSRPLQRRAVGARSVAHAQGRDKAPGLRLRECVARRGRTQAVNAGPASANTFAAAATPAQRQESSGATAGSKTQTHARSSSRQGAFGGERPCHLQQVGTQQGLLQAHTARPGACKRCQNTLPWLQRTRAGSARWLPASDAVYCCAHTALCPCPTVVCMPSLAATSTVVLLFSSSVGQHSIDALAMFKPAERSAVAPSL